LPASGAWRYTTGYLNFASLRITATVKLILEAFCHYSRVLISP